MVEASLPFTRADGRDAGLSDRQMSRRLRTGQLTAVRRGVLIDAHSHELVSVGTVSAELRAALASSRSRDLVVSHLSAARLYGLPAPMAGWPVDQQFVSVSGSNRRRRGIHVRVTSLEADQVVQHLGLAVTSPARTVADCLRVLPGRDGLALADAALHRSLLSTEQLGAVLAGQAGWPGIGIARQIVPQLNSERESPLESWSAWAFAHTQLALPRWQVDICDADGRFIGRADCWWPAGVVGEADGRAKYELAAAARGGADSTTLFDVLQQERLREQRLRDVGADVVRWSAADVLSKGAATRLAERLTRAIDEAGAYGRFRGVALPSSPR